MEAPSEFRLNSSVDRHCYSSTDAAGTDNSGEAKSSLKVTEPSNLHVQTNVAALMREV